ncbi:hypothetical protein WCX72_09990 [Sulfurimonas sp. HSL1-6]|uniref:hypothetical protein n=1 Tax=Thiomicrolovo immobilis TaxID=3131935 RepID=UPI0031F7CC81
MTLLTQKTFDLLSTTAADTSYPAWDSAGSYALDDKVIYNRYIYKCIDGAPATPPAWSNVSQYAAGDRVDYSSATYAFLSEYLSLPSPDSDSRYDLQTYTTWNDTTTYSAGDVVLVYSWYPMLRKLYRCKVGNTGQTPSCTSTYWDCGNLWNDTTFYASGAFVLVGAGPGTPYVTNSAITAETPDVDTTNWSQVTPENDTTVWKKVGPANSLRMFDAQNTTKTVGTGALTVAVEAYEVDGLYFAGLDADSITIKVYNTVTEALIEDNAYDLTFEPEDWLAYFMGTWMTKSRKSSTYWRTTMDRDVIIEVTFDKGTENAACGVMIIGEAKPIAVSIWDVRRGGVDYTVVTQNTDGSSTATETAVYLPLIDIDSIVDTDATARVIADLEAVRNTPIAIIGDESDTYEAVNIFGVISSFGVTLQGPSKSTVSMEVTGLY